MLARNIFLLFSLLVLAVTGDHDANDAGAQAISTDKDSTSDESPTAVGFVVAESMNVVVSPDQPDESHVYGEGPSDPSSSHSETADPPSANQVTAPEPAVASASSAEEDDEDESNDSGEAGRKKPGSRSAKPQGPAHLQNSPAIIIQMPALPSQPVIVPSPKRWRGAGRPRGDPGPTVGRFRSSRRDTNTQPQHNSDPAPPVPCDTKQLNN
ncbi:hypothetical protein OJAV_G00114660 [Oryzias javanicus]|uniref:Uncharacterized protein n=1 Tax=Oryzias javanicus TaxID=123683 RepID=A0A437CXA2_ORYJA|nr:hypothetical protein OJAV_G00114660 [Oryzias javanicus]